jgi:hypothetical protein
MGAEDLFVAIEAGAVEVADLSSGATTSIVEAVRRSNASRNDAYLDDMVTGFLARVVQILEDPKVFPLLDAQSSGLVRGLEESAGVSLPPKMSRGAEVTAATGFMNFLPYFPDLPMDEALDLRKELAKPLGSFRAAVARLSRQFDARPVDEHFDIEVEDAWREQVAPALTEIRESLAEHGLLREARSVVEGDAKTLLGEAGGVLAISSFDIISLSGLLTAGIAAGVPLASVAGKALKGRREARQQTRRNAFYFLHRLSDEAYRRGG